MTNIHDIDVICHWLDDGRQMPSIAMPFAINNDAYDACAKRFRLSEVVLYENAMENSRNLFIRTPPKS
jgi:hypothetical protein